MHPIERLRYVARAEGAGPSALVRAAAGALAGFSDEPVALVTACRRLVERHPAIGPMWELAARVMSAPDPDREAWRVAGELDEDPTTRALATEIPNGLRVAVIGWSELVAETLVARGDLHALVVDAAGEGVALVRKLRSSGADADEVAESGLGPAVADADLVLLEALAVGPDGFVAACGSLAAACVARACGVPIWLVVGAARALPPRMWGALVDRLDWDSCEPWERLEEVVSIELVDRVIGPTGAADPAEVVRWTACPVAPELLKPIEG